MHDGGHHDPTHADVTPTRGHGGGHLMQKQAPSIGRILVAAGFTLSCFGLILFLWIAFGGPTPLKAEELPDHRLLPGGDAARGRVRRPDRRRLGRQGQGGRPGALRPARRGLRHDRGDDRDRAAVRADLERRARDSAAEDAARRDLRGADLGHRAGGRGRRRRTAGGAGRLEQRHRCRGRGGRADRGGRRTRRVADTERDPDRRDLQRARRRDAGCLPALAGERGRRDQGARPGRERRARQPRAVRDRRRRRSSRR